MSATNYFENALLQLIFNNVSVSDIADGIANAGDLYVSLHTSDPGESGVQVTNEVNYTSYARVAVERGVNGWTISGNSATNTGTVTFPIATGGTSTASHFGIGTDAVGSGTLLLKGALVTPLDISNGIRPIFDVADLVINLD